MQENLLATLCPDPAEGTYSAPQTLQLAVPLPEETHPALGPRPLTRNRLGLPQRDGLDQPAMR